MKIVIFTTSHAAMKDLSLMYTNMETSLRSRIALSIFNIEGELSEEEWERVKARAEEAEFIIHDPHGTPAQTLSRLHRICAALDTEQVIVGGNAEGIQELFRLGSLRYDDIAGKHQHGKPHASADQAECREDLECYRSLVEYWRHAGIHNMQHMLGYIAARLGKKLDWPAVEPPAALKAAGIYDPCLKRPFDSIEAYRLTVPVRKELPTVAVLFMGYSYPLHTGDIVGSIIQDIRPFANVLPVAFASLVRVDPKRLKDLLMHGGTSGNKVDLIVNFVPFRLGAGPTGGKSEEMLSMLKELEAPMLHPFFLTRRERSDWELSAQGLTPSEFLVQMMLPELDGSIDTLPVAALSTRDYDEEMQLHTKELQLIEERAHRLVSRIRRYLALRSKPQSEKRIAIIGYNYPLGEGNLFQASLLDTFESISRLTAALKAHGYETDTFTGAELKERFLREGLINSGDWADERWSESLPRISTDQYVKNNQVFAKREDELREQWGEAPGSIMTIENEAFKIPGLISGNLFIGLQPSRGVHENPEAAYHDKSLLPHHQYLAFYQYIRDEFKADAILHVGTHGTIEFMAGKESGMSGDCVPDAMISDLPHFYAYYVGNPSEAMIAKRRTHAVLLGYQSPPFTASGLYGEYAALEGLLHEYREAERLNPARLPGLWRRLQEQAEALSLEADDLEQIESELYRMRRSLIPEGLHVLGEGYTHEQAAGHMRMILSHDNRALGSLQRIYATTLGWDYDQLLDGQHIDKLRTVDEHVEQAVRSFMQTSSIPDAPGGLNEELQARWQELWEKGMAAYHSTNAEQEIQQLLSALDGKYVPVRLAGDYIRNPEVLPSGYNLVQFDPRAIPTQTAASSGWKIAENTLKLYYKSHHQYPDTTALVMWGLETSRTQGETLGQILAYLGVRIKERGAMMPMAYEIVPLAELNRPRLNVIVHICGFFRDMFPEQMIMLHRIFQDISELDEPMDQNLFKRHSVKLYEQLRLAGAGHNEAWDLACARIYGPAEGEYGTSVTKLIETKQWEDESQLGEAFMSSLKHVYSSKYRGEDMYDLYKANLAAVDIVSQIRSNHEHEVTDLDHYYEFFGGLAKSVEIAKGTKAAIYITDSTGERALTEEVRKSVQRGVRTRLLNPKWMDGLLKHDYHGAQKIADRIENLLGLAATTHEVDSWIFSAVHKEYVADEQRSKQMRDNNRWAYHSMLETLLESHQRQYWQASDEELQMLHERYLELEGELESNE